MAIALVTGQHAYTLPNGADPVTVDFPGSVTTGNLLIAAVGFNTNGDIAVITSVTSNRTTGNWACATHSAGGDVTDAIYYAVATGTGACTVTVDFTAGQAYQDVRISEFTGFTASPVLDQVAGAPGGPTGPAVTGNSPSTTANDELIFTSGMTNSGFSGVINTGYSLMDLTDPDNDTHGYKVVSATGVQSASHVLGSNGSWIALLATFKAGGGGDLNISVAECISSEAKF